VIRPGVVYLAFSSEPRLLFDLSASVWGLIWGPLWVSGRPPDSGRQRCSGPGRQVLRESPAGREGWTGEAFGDRSGGGSGLKDRPEGASGLGRSPQDSALSGPGRMDCVAGSR
jgi:hypothetical protein